MIHYNFRKNKNDFHIENRNSCSSSPVSESSNVDNSTADAVINRRIRPLPILSKAAHRCAITIEDILTDSCAAKHEFEYLGIVRIDATIGKDVHWSKCIKCGLDKFKLTRAPRYD